MPRYDYEGTGSNNPNVNVGEPRVTVLNGRVVVVYKYKGGGYVARTCSPNGGVHPDTPIRPGGGGGGVIRDDGGGKIEDIDDITASSGRLLVMGGQRWDDDTVVLALSPGGGHASFDMSGPWPPGFEPMRMAAGGDRVFILDARSHVWAFDKRTGGGRGTDTYIRNAGFTGSDLHNRQGGGARWFQDIAATDDCVFVMEVRRRDDPCRITKFDHDGRGISSSTDVCIPDGFSDICMDADGSHACIIAVDDPLENGYIIPLDHQDHRVMRPIRIDSYPIDVAVYDGYAYVASRDGVFIERIV